MDNSQCVWLDIFSCNLITSIKLTAITEFIKQIIISSLVLVKCTASEFDIDFYHFTACKL